MIMSTNERTKKRIKTWTSEHARPADLRLAVLDASLVLRSNLIQRVRFELGRRRDEILVNLAIGRFFLLLDPQSLGLLRCFRCGFGSRGFFRSS